MTKEQLAKELYPMEEGNFQMNSYQSEKRRAFIAGYEAAVQQVDSPKWISVEAAKPSTNNLVLVKCEKDYDGRIHAFCTMAIYVPKFTVLEEDLMGEDFWEQGDYDDVTGTYYTPEGWYEWQSEPDMNYKISATVTHWMPLPKKPQL